MKRKSVVILLVIIFSIFTGCLLNVNRASLQTNSNFELETYALNEEYADDLLYTSYWNASQIKNCIIKDSIAYLACGEDGFTILNISNKTTPQLISTIQYGDFYFEEFVLSDETLYCYNDTTLYLFDITDMSLPIFINDFSDFKEVYVMEVRDNIGYLSCRNLTNQEGLLVLNFTNPFSITKISRFDYDIPYDIWWYQDNIEVEDNLLILSSSSSNKIHFLNISNLLSITIINSLSALNAYFISDHRVLSINSSYLSIYDIENISKIILLSTIRVDSTLTFYYQNENLLFFSDWLDFSDNIDTNYNRWYRINHRQTLNHIYQLDEEGQISWNSTGHFYPAFHLPHRFASYDNYIYIQEFNFIPKTIIHLDDVSFVFADKELFIASPDKDRDMLPSFLEKALKLNDTNSDVDGDFLDDGAEHFVYNTATTNPDSDFDGWTDGKEIYLCETDPLDRKSRLLKGGLILQNSIFSLIFLLPIVAGYAAFAFFAKYNPKEKRMKISGLLVKNLLLLIAFLGLTIPFLITDIIGSFDIDFTRCGITISGHWIEYQKSDPSLSFSSFASDCGSFSANIPLFAYLAIGFFSFSFLIEIIIEPLKLSTKSDKRRVIFERILLGKILIIVLGLIFSLVCCSFLLKFYFQIEGGILSQFDERAAPLYFYLSWPFWLFLAAQFIFILDLSLQLANWRIDIKKRKSKDLLNDN